MLGLKFRNNYERAMTSPDPLKRDKLQTNYCLFFFCSQGIDGMEVINARFDFMDDMASLLLLRSVPLYGGSLLDKAFVFRRRLKGAQFYCCFCFSHVQTSLLIEKLIVY